MQKLKKKNSELALVVTCLTMIFLLGACKEERRLPFWGERDVVYKTVNGKEVADTIIPRVPGFEYLNQDSVWKNSSDFKNKVLVVDFFFTNCPTICPPMTTNMKRLNILTKDLNEHIEYISFSIDPTRDTPTRMREYIQEHGIKATNWSFMTGRDEKKTHEMAKYYFSGAEKNDNIPGGYGHTTYFSLIDKNGYVRGVYDGTNSDAIDSMANDIKLLFKTEYND